MTHSEHSHLIFPLSQCFGTSTLSFWCRFRGSEVAGLLPLTGYVEHHSKIDLYYLPKYAIPERSIYGGASDPNSNCGYTKI
jgi:hypothetical protein